MKVDEKDYHKYYLEAPDNAQLKEYRKALKRAWEQRLRTGALLSWTGPNLHPSTLPPSTYPAIEPSDLYPHQPRPALQPLLSPSSPAFGGVGWSLRLVEPLQEEKTSTAQIWKCEVVPPAKLSFSCEMTVILKLRQESLFPEPQQHDSVPEVDDWNWVPAEYYEAQESFVYSSLRSLQGRVLPICYGFFNFVLPSGEVSVGVVLEDLTTTTISLKKLFKNEKKKKNLTSKLYAPLAEVPEPFPQFYECLRAQSLVHQTSEIFGVLELPDSCLVVPETLQLDRPAVIFIGFGLSNPAAWRTETYINGVEAEKGTPIYNPEELNWDWRMGDQETIWNVFWMAVEGSSLKGEWRTWSKKNKKKILKEIPFLKDAVLF
ncbi:hypothetical protein T439DRAFT_364183 [Meredithblackwellia eburnea MCA 4105]